MSLRIQLSIRFLVVLPLLLISLSSLANSNAPQCNAVDIYWRVDCPHCQAAHKFLEQLQKEHPQIKVSFFNIHQSKQIWQHFQQVNQEYAIQRPGVPTILVCGEIIIGFDHVETTGLQIKQMLGLTRSKEEVNEVSKSVQLPWFGDVSASEFGLPAFTLAIGLVDGFNPCAMWVLLFLLSILVNVKSRRRIIAIAGTFVLVSGLVYFAFMAAWLNLFFLLGWSRHLQVFVAFLALLIGAIHLKDFFAFKQGISLSIPEHYKPTLFKRVRRIVSENRIGFSIISVALLAIIINFIELLCTAGLPVLYTQILSQQDLSKAQYYGYLALYNLAYIFDDGIMVSIAVYTLHHRKLQLQQGKWLKLLSGAVILGLGVLLLLKPQWIS